MYHLSIGRISADTITRAIRHALADLPLCGSYHDIRVHPQGDGWSTSLHCLLGETVPLRQAHALCSQIEEHLLNTVPRLSQVIVHAEPLTRSDEPTP